MLQHDEFVDRVIQDPSNPQEVTLVFGFIGNGSDDEHVRIYSDANLSAYIECRIDDVVFAKPAPPDSLGGSHVWMRAGADITYRYDDTTIISKNNLVVGELEQRYMAKAKALTDDMKNERAGGKHLADFMRLDSRACCHPKAFSWPPDSYPYPCSALLNCTLDPGCSVLCGHRTLPDIER